MSHSAKSTKREITKQKKVQEIIRAAREYAENIVETVREPLIVLNTNLKIISANRSFYKTFKVKPHETEGKFLYHLGNRQWNIPKLRQLLEEILPKHTTFEDYEVEHNFKTIGLKTMLLNARRIYRKTDKKKTILLAIEDITERKKLEKMKDEFLSMVSHELRTPLTVIALGIDNLKSGILGPISEAQAEALDRGQRNVRRLSKLIENLLDLSRLESGRTKIQQKEIHLTPLIHEIVQSYQGGKRGRNLKIKEKHKKDLPTVEADSDMVAQALTNLFSNAILYAKKEIVVATTIAKPESGSPQFIEISIANDGPGIPRQKMDDLFKKFIQLDREKRTGPYKGTGLGLAICKEIIERHRGKIWVESPEKTGVTFRFTLPIAGKRRKNESEKNNIIG
ncbi:MAG: PAS domain-containing sensor histidine kinase [Deltaproteobacteria bacterium]|nr:PAS domain-containing sensor histidine kinase [Deltaproteobacteria bacterium]